MKKKCYVFIVNCILLLNISTVCYAKELSSQTQGKVLTNAITISDGYVRETIPGTSISSAYMKITNTGNYKVILQKIEGTVSNKIEIHQHTMENGMMRMSKLPLLEIPPNSSVILQPAGVHLMIFNLSTPLKNNTSVDLILYFIDKTSLAITLPVKSIKTASK